jgi:hypothetical protein
MVGCRVWWTLEMEKHFTNFTNYFITYTRVENSMAALQRLQFGVKYPVDLGLSLRHSGSFGGDNKREKKIPDEDKAPTIVSMHYRFKPVDVDESIGGGLLLVIYLLMKF